MKAFRKQKCLLGHTCHLNHKGEETDEYEKQCDTMSTDLDSLSRVMGTSNISALFAMIKNLITKQGFV